jgi:hypothetical protein
MNLAPANVKWKLRTVAFSPHVPFEMRSRLLYWERSRSWPTRHPVTFSQKLLWKMVHDRRPLITTFADKVAVRDYVAAAVGPEVLSEVYAVVEDPADLDPALLPGEFVVKPNHASSLIWIVADWAGDEVRVSENVAVIADGMRLSTRRGLDWDMLTTTCRTWLATDYSDAAQEWAYRRIPRRILVEELLTGPEGTTPTDYKFFVINGRVRMVETHSDRFDGHSVHFAHPDWTPMDVDIDFPLTVPPPERPESLERMVAMAETLGRETDFVRVDLYDLGDRIVFGELTNYPGGLSAAKYYPDELLGQYWTLPDRYT